MKVKEGETMRERYIRLERRAGFKKGDRVRVKKKARTRERGWNNSWVDDMGVSVGEVFTVQDISEDGTGILLSSDPRFWYPYFVLEKVKVGDKPKIKRPHKHQWVYARYACCYVLKCRIKSCGKETKAYHYLGLVPQVGQRVMLLEDGETIVVIQDKKGG